jgi:hypothetical protein
VAAAGRDVGSLRADAREGVVEPFYVGFIVCPDTLVDHIGRRGLSFDDVRDAVQAPASPESLSWLDDPEDSRGPRLLARGWTDQGKLIGVILYPIDLDDGTWRLGTAFYL